MPVGPTCATVRTSFVSRVEDSIRSDLALLYLLYYVALVVMVYNEQCRNQMY